MSFFYLLCNDEDCGTADLILLAVKIAVAVDVNIHGQYLIAHGWHHNKALPRVDKAALNTGLIAGLYCRLQKAVGPTANHTPHRDSASGHILVVVLWLVPQASPVAGQSAASIRASLAWRF